MDMLTTAFSAQSPRLRPRPPGVASVAVGLVPLVLYPLLVAQAFVRTGLGGWAVGIAYIFYDTLLLAMTAWGIRRLTATPPPSAPAGAMRPTLAVIVAARNEAAVLAVTIDTLAAQADPPELIVLADDGSDDGSAEVLRERYGLDMPAYGTLGPPSPVLPALRWLRLAHGGKARALNAALAHVESDVVLTVDADTLLAPGALQAMRDAFAVEPELVAATGVLQPICGRAPVARLFQWFQRYEYVRNFLSRYAWMGQNGLLLISGAFAGFRRSAVMAVGGFDPDCMVEDYELIHRIHRHAHDTGQDWRVRVIGHALASTDAPAAALPFLRQRRRWFGGFLQTQHWNRDMVANPAYGRLGTRMLVVKALDTLQPVYGISAFVILIWLLASGRLFVASAILGVMAGKIVIDLAFHVWSLGVYRRWTGQSAGLGTGMAIVASVIEPFSFQLLRHAGACWGWVAFLTGRETWVRQRRTALPGMQI